MERSLNWLWWIVAAAVVGLVAWAMISSRPQPQTVTKEGVIACLPPKDTKSLTTLQCAIGVKTDDGQYYSLDSSRLANPLITFPNDTRVRVTGDLGPMNDSSGQFKADGVIVVSSIDQI